MRTTRPTPARRPALAVASLAASVLLLGACAGPADDDAADDPTPSASPTSAEPTDEASSSAPTEESEEPAGPTLEVTVAGDQVGPNVEEIDLAVGEPLTITFQADRAGELHVHSNPEQYVEFTEGRSEQTLTIGTPGTVEVEEHETGAVVAVLTVA